MGKLSSPEALSTYPILDDFDCGHDALNNWLKHRARTLQAADIAGISAFVVHAFSDKAKRFYERFGFQASPTDPMDLMITLKDAKTHVS